MTTSDGEKTELFEHLNQHYRSLCNKLKWLRRKLKYRKQARQDLETSIGTAPAYVTGQRDGVFYTSAKTFTDAYKAIEIGSMPNKTRKTSFQVLSRIIWTKKKAYHSRSAESAACKRCVDEKTIEHLLY
jgi:hypothetical protein